MPAVEFHTGLSDKRDYAMRLLRKASRQGARLVLVCDGVADWSSALWRLSAVDFVAHCTDEADADVQALSPILLATASGTWTGRDVARDVLVNARQEWHVDFGLFDRVIELVSQEPSDVAAGRVRWKQYLAHGIRPNQLG